MAGRYAVCVWGSFGDVLSESEEYAEVSAFGGGAGCLGESSVLVLVCWDCGLFCDDFCSLCLPVYLSPLCTPGAQLWY